MAYLSPTLHLLWDVKFELENGKSVLTGVQKFIERNLDSDLTIEVQKWRMSQINAQNYVSSEKIFPTQRQLLAIYSQGMRGVPILETLKSIEIELIESSEDIIQAHILKLPIVLLLPLMLFIFPAVFFILLGPLLMNFISN